ncbi:MAG: copper resistance protein NlpE N-terminal domain-containing protein [Flavobacteriaceae bacterium]|nr:copper resistance protein NlpE N-terminal domain-containing protein [Flavobacteriaceae bacterium]
MLRLFIFISATVIFTLYSCSTDTAPNSVSPIVENTVTKEDTLGWIGTYTGTVPDANSVGLEMKLVLNPSNTYDLQITHLQKNPKDNIIENITGEINWEEDSTTIILKEVDSIYSNKFRIKPGIVEYLNPDATPNTGKLAEFYVLKKK